MVTVSPSASPVVFAVLIVISGLLEFSMLVIAPPTMAPGYPLKLTPKTPVRPLPLMVMTSPGWAPAGPVMLVGTTVPLVIEKVNGCRALLSGGVQFPTELVLKVTKAGVQ